MYNKILFVLLTMALVTLPLMVSACSKPQPGSEENSRQVAEEYVKLDSTYRFDGIPETFKLSSTTSIANGWKYTIEFDSQHPGYGNRTGQVLAQVITHHIAAVNVSEGRVVSAIMDSKWDMVKQQELPK